MERPLIQGSWRRSQVGRDGGWNQRGKNVAAGGRPGVGAGGLGMIDLHLGEKGFDVGREIIGGGEIAALQGGQRDGVGTAAEVGVIDDGDRQFRKIGAGEGDDFFSEGAAEQNVIFREMKGGEDAVDRGAVFFDGLRFAAA